MSFKENDRVRVMESSAHRSAGELGTVSHVYDVARSAYRVKLDSGNESGFFESELELLDEKREALITLAETLDSARQKANAIEETAPQRGVYGQIELALVDVLELIFVEKVDDHNMFANLTLNTMIDSGLSVREALKKVEK